MPATAFSDTTAFAATIAMGAPMRDHGRMLMPPKLTISLLSDELAVCRLPADGPSPSMGGAFYSITRTADEVSVVCPAASIPPGAQAERGWRAFVVDGPLDFALVGVLDSMLTPLVAARVPVFAISTYTTDYVLVRENDVRPAITALKIAGHTVRPPAPSG